MGSPKPATNECRSLAWLLHQAAAAGASDLHLAAGTPPLLRLDGALVPSGIVALTSGEIEALCQSLLDHGQRELLAASGGIDFATEGQEFGRVRASIFRRRGTLAACLRLVPAQVPTLASLGLPPAVAGLLELRHGLLLVTGPTGNGKSTTLAAIVRGLLDQRPIHVLTIEDPIELVHQPGLGLINQRELGADTPSFAHALRQALRQDPDVILVGEMRDPETVHAALTLAETGHLVLSTLHSPTATQSVRRIIDMFPVSEHGALRSQLAEVLQAIIAQALLPQVGSGRVLACELLIAKSAVRALIRDDKIHQLPSQIESGQAQSGMQSLAQSVAALLCAGRINSATARLHGVSSAG